MLLLDQLNDDVLFTMMLYLGEQHDELQLVCKRWRQLILRKLRLFPFSIINEKEKIHNISTTGKMLKQYKSYCKCKMETMAIYLIKNSGSLLRKKICHFHLLNIATIYLLPRLIDTLTEIYHYDSLSLSIAKYKIKYMMKKKQSLFDNIDTTEE